MKRPLGVLVLVTQFLLAHYSTAGQEVTLPGQVVLPEAEAPRALFARDIDDAGVEFFLSGSWTATLAGSLGWLFSPGGGTVFPSDFPGFDAGQLFRQNANLTVSVWLAERYFLEASVIGSFLDQEFDYFGENYLLLGYRGTESEFLRHVYLGTREVAIAPYPFLNVPAAGSSSIGASALLAGAWSRHELLLRYDNNEPLSYTFLGRNLLSEEILQLGEYTRGRFFTLPDAGVTGLEVYLEDPDGPFTGEDAWGHSRSYRLATLVDAVLDSAAGTVFLRKPSEGAVLVYYRVGPGEIGASGFGLGIGALPAETAGKIDLSGPALDFEWGSLELADYFGQDIDDRQVTIGGRTALRLFRPGEFSPFEILGGYPLQQAVPAELSRVRVSVTLKGSETPVSAEVRFRLIPGANHLTAYLSADLRGSFRNLYPFLDAHLAESRFDPENLLYGPLADPSPGYPRYEVRVGYLIPVSEFRLGADVVPGSVQVLRNGIPETRFTVDYATGLLEFLTPIAEDDRLEVRFRRRQALAYNGDLLFAWGNTVSLGDSHTLELATGLRWNFLPGTYTSEAYSRTGGVLASAALRGRLGPAEYEVAVAGAYTNPDTSGIMRLLSMEAGALEVPLSEEIAYPAAPPASDSSSALPALTADSRGRLLYKDYRAYGLAGTAVLMPYTWEPPPEQIFAYATGSKPGPYLAAGSPLGGQRGQSLVLDFELDAAGDWVGSQIPLVAGGQLADLSGLEGLSVSYEAVDSPGAFELYVQIGDISEDLDADGVLDRELSAAAAGFLFNDTANLAILRVGTDPRNESNNRLDSEDVDGNGVLDRGNSAHIVTGAPEAVSGDTGPRTLSYRFSASERARLGRTRGIRLVVVNTSGGANTGRLLVDRITLAGSRFWATAAAGTVSVGEVEEWQALNRPAVELVGAYPEVQEVFHPLAERQKVLEVQWRDGPTDWAVRGYTEAATEGIDYRSIVYYYRLPTEVADGTLEYSLTDAGGRGVAWSIPAARQPEWRKVRVDLDQRRVYLDGVVLSGADVSLDPGYGSLSVFAVSLSGSSAAEGLLYLDELHLRDPRAALGAGGSLKLDVDLPGVLWEVGGHPLLHNVRFRERADFSTAGFSGLYGIPNRNLRLSSRSDLEAGISVADLAVNLDVVAQANEAALEVGLGGGHRIALPNVPFPLAVSDSFSYRERDSGPSLRRESRLSLDLAPLLQVRLFNTGGNLDDTLTQEWGALLGLTPGRFSFQNTFELILARSGFSVPREGYFPSWGWGYSLLAPSAEGTALARTAAVDLDWQLASRPVGVRLLGALDLNSYELSDEGRTQASRFALDLGLPMELGGASIPAARRVQLLPGYRRTLGLLARESASGTVGEDFLSAFAGLASQSYAYSGVPFHELYDPVIERRFLADSLNLPAARFAAETYLSLSRSFSSRLQDLFVPSYFEVALEKSLEREGDLTALANRYTLQSRWRAINLFGRFGSYPLLGAYRTDEFSTDFILGLLTEGGEVRIDELRLEHAFGFENAEAGILSFENRLRLTRQDAIQWSNGSFVVFEWFRYPEGGVTLPLLPPRLGAEAFWSHRERLSVSLNGPPAAQEADSYHPLNLVVDHQTSLTLPGAGLLSARAGVGLDFERTSAGELYWRLGLQAALEVRLEF